MQRTPSQYHVVHWTAKYYVGVIHSEFSASKLHFIYQTVIDPLRSMTLLGGSILRISF